MKKQKSERYYKVWYRIFYPIFRLISRIKYGIKGVKPKKYKEPILVFSNHTTDMDFICVSSYIKNHMYFVCSQHVLGMGLLGKLLKRWFNPIAVYKGSKKQKEVMDILRRVKKGSSVLIFPEGKISHDGLSTKLDVSVGKLAKMVKCKIVTFRTEGGYFKQPRWQNYNNKGKLFSHGIVGEYDVDTIQQLSPEEITDLINRDLFVDAYQLQESKQKSFKLKKGVLDVTRYFSVCPNCKEIGEMQSTKKEITCKCGYKLTLDNKFYLHETSIASSSAVKTFKEWNNLQQSVIKEMFNKQKNISESDVGLYEIGEAHESRKICQGNLLGSTKGLTLGNQQFNFDKMEGLEVLSGGSSLVFAYDGVHYEMKAQKASLVIFLEYYNFSVA